MDLIPAMTTEAERECYYRLAKEGAASGAVIELGAWLGASTAYIAAGIRDSGAGIKAHVYDRFVSQPSHAAKVRAFYDERGIDTPMPSGPCIEQFRENLGSLNKHIKVHEGEISDIKWDSSPISVLIADAPKRVPQISAVLTRLRKGLQPGAVMAWQDFGHFPSYEIPACLYRLRDHLEFVEAVVPGTTLVFHIKSQWTAEEASTNALSVNRWTPEDITDAWNYWSAFVPPEKRALFECGAAMFLCDIGWSDAAVPALALVYERQPEAILPKWQYLHRVRAGFRTRYKPLFDYLEKQGALCSA